MPEGPSIVILKELVKPFEGMKVVAVSGSAKIDKEKVEGKKVIAFKSWGKHFLICFKDCTFRVHLLLFGSYAINGEKDATPKLGLHFKKGMLNFYSCSVKLIDQPLDEVYDWSTDIMSHIWSAANAIKKLRNNPDMLVCDALLDQDIFAGSGNIIKNEVLFRLRIHPLSKVSKLPTKQLRLLVDETRTYAFQFLEWKKRFELKKHWVAYTKKTCPRCHILLLKASLGKQHRRTFFCNNCQVLYQ